MSGFTNDVIDGDFGVCSCGMHHGVRNLDMGKKIGGIPEVGSGWTPEQRASVYAWFWDRNERMFGGSGLSKEMADYLASWVKTHGIVYPSTDGFKCKSPEQLSEWAGGAKPHTRRIGG